MALPNTRQQWPEWGAAVRRYDELLIGGRWHRPARARTIDAFAPATLDRGEWMSWNAHRRADCAGRIGRIFKSRADELMTQLISEEVGSPRALRRPANRSRRRSRRSPTRPTSAASYLWVETRSGANACNVRIMRLPARRLSVWLRYPSRIPMRTARCESPPTPRTASRACGPKMPSTRNSLPAAASLGWRQ
jgi:hypothetical protein